MKPVAVTFENKPSASYNIFVGSGVLSNLSAYLQESDYGKIFIVMDDFLFKNHLHNLKPFLLDGIGLNSATTKLTGMLKLNHASLSNKTLKSSEALEATNIKEATKKFDKPQVHIDADCDRLIFIVIPVGEISKSFKTTEWLAENLIEQKIERGDLLIGFGGGVVGDVTGFLASIILRSVDFIQLPTTLLSMVDSSVGGKTGINSKFGKNLIGSFYQPKLVVSDVDFLKTLDADNLKAGYAEIVKYGLIADAEFFEFLDKVNILQSDILAKNKGDKRADFDNSAFDNFGNISVDFPHSSDLANHTNSLNNSDNAHNDSPADFYGKLKQPNDIAADDIADSDVNLNIAGNDAVDSDEDGNIDGENHHLTQAILRSCQIKADIVSLDEREAGVRALLNLGHSFGHAFENLANYSGILHGLAVSVGQIMAFEFASLMGICAKSDYRKVKKHFQKMSMPLYYKEFPALAGISAEDILQKMLLDKKVQKGKIRLILPRAIGNCEVFSDISREEILQYLQNYITFGLS